MGILSMWYCNNFPQTVIVMCRAANALCDYSCKSNIFLLIKACMIWLYYFVTRHTSQRTGNLMWESPMVLHADMRDFFFLYLTFSNLGAYYNGQIW